MSDTIVKVDNLSKKYVIGHQRTERYQTFRDAMVAQARGWGNRLMHPFRSAEGGMSIADSREEFYALEDISFEIKRGDRVGIIGRNGAGKSTLLKILSRITEPSSGRIEIDGRVASLLEVGTGFHPELTGRENIFLNGAILGMTKAEIRRNFDEIVAFAEVERFLDTPVKRYSSGMYVRLAFAVAAHLEPEVLIVDEVLAVGDAQFQKKCLGKMEEVGQEGRTVLFVSHNMAAIRQLCVNGLVLEGGRLSYSGCKDNAIESYMKSVSADTNGKNKKYNHVAGDGRVKISSVEVLNDKDVAALVSVFDRIVIKLNYVVEQNIDFIEFFVLFYSYDGEVITSFFQRDSGNLTQVKGIDGCVTLSLQNIMCPGNYLVSVGIFDKSRNFVDWVEYAEKLTVESSFLGGRPYDSRLGKTTQIGQWSSSDGKY